MSRTADRGGSVLLHLWVACNIDYLPQFERRFQIFPILQSRHKATSPIVVRDEFACPAAAALNLVLWFIYLHLDPESEQS